jgi:hypothetical protein
MELKGVFAPSSNLCPGCGLESESRSHSAVHKRACPILRQRVIEEIKRLSTVLGRAPATTDWTLGADKGLPTVSWLQVNLGRWTVLLDEAGLVPSNWRELCAPPVLRPTRYYWQDEEEAAKKYGFTL